MAMQRFLFFSVAVACLILCSEATSCYYPDGKTIESGHVPCNSTINTSACCDPLDSCTTSGLCLGRTGFNYRGSCTDSTWQSANCPSGCHNDPFNSAAYSTFTALFPCSALGEFSADFCCYSPNGNCCTTDTFSYGTTGVAFKAGMDLLLAEISSVSSSSHATGQATSQATVVATVTATAITTTTVGAASQTDAASSGTVHQTSSSSNLGAAIGAGVGVPLGLLSAGLLGFLFWRERRHSRRGGEVRAKGLEMDSAQTGGDTAQRGAPHPQEPYSSAWSPENHHLVRGASMQKSELSGSHDLVHELI